MITRKSTSLVLMVLLTLVSVSCNNNSNEVAIQPSKSNANSSTSTPTSSPIRNTPDTNRNSNIYSPSIPGALSSENTRKYLERAARNNYVINDQTYGNKSVAVVLVIREYKDHPPLDKLVRGRCLDKSCKEYKYEVRLRNGKKCELPEGKIQNPQTASPEEILEAIGDCIKD